MATGTDTSAATADDGDFTDRYGKAIAVIFLALVITHLPLISLVTLLPFFKEVVIAAIVVAAMTAISDAADAAKYAVIAGMTAAVVFNLVWIPAQFVLGGVFAAASGASASGSLAGGALSGLGALSNLIGLIVFSPIGYAVGGVLGSLFN